MKLHTGYNYITFVAATVALIIGSVCYYFIIRYVLLSQLDEGLRVEQREVFDYVKMHQHLPEPTDYKSLKISFQHFTDSIQQNLSSITILDTTEKEDEPYRQLVFPVNVNGDIYKVTIKKSQVETEDLVTVMVVITLLLIVLLLFGLLILNRLALQNLWQPFYKTLESLQQFNLVSRNEITLPSSDIDEFNTLNQAVLAMTNKVAQDYDILRNFTDDASHEMQTPLAVIRMQLDLLIQDDTITASQMDRVQAIYDSLERLSKLTRMLLLLAKIENNQFVVFKQVELKSVVDEKVKSLTEIISAKGLQLKLELSNTVISINPTMMDVLLTNLLGNAVRHNVAGGYIGVYLTLNQLKIVNSGAPLSFNSNLLFNRFQKSHVSDGNGLGLAIVKQICDTSNITIRYHYLNNEHQFTIDF